MKADITTKKKKKEPTGRVLARETGAAPEQLLVAQPYRNGVFPHGDDARVGRVAPLSDHHPPHARSVFTRSDEVSQLRLVHVAGVPRHRLVGRRAQRLEEGRHDRACVT